MPSFNRLGGPIEIRLVPPSIAGGPDAAAAAEYNARELARAVAASFEKLERLFPHYGLVRTGKDADFRALALCLADDQLRDFKVVNLNAPKPYEHSRSNWVTLMMLLADVETVKREHSRHDCADGQALRALITRHPRRWGTSGKHRRRPANWRTLKNWLGDAHNPEKNPGIALWRLAESCDRLPAMIEVFGSARWHET